MTEEDNIKCTGTATVTDPKMAPNYFILADMLSEIRRTLVLGCGNHGCRIRKPDGVSGNGPCACKPEDLPAKIRWIADQLGPDDGAREWPPDPMRI